MLSPELIGDVTEANHGCFPCSKCCISDSLLTLDLYVAIKSRYL